MLGIVAIVHQAQHVYLLAPLFSADFGDTALSASDLYDRALYMVMGCYHH